MKLNIRIVGVIMLGLLALILGYTIKKNYDLKDTTNTQEQNIKTLRDTLRVELNNAKQLEYSKGLLITEKKNLKNLNDKLSDELKKSQGKISELTNYTAKVNPTEKSPITSKKDELKSSNNTDFSIAWNFDTIYNKNNELKLSGETYFTFIKGDSIQIIPKRSTIFNLEEKINITQGLREKNGLLEVYVTSDHPYLKIDDLSSVIIDPKDHVLNQIITQKPKRFSLGPVMGYGFTNNGTAFFIGVSVGYNLIRF